MIKMYAQQVVLGKLIITFVTRPGGLFAVSRKQVCLKLVSGKTDEMLDIDNLNKKSPTYPFGKNLVQPRTKQRYSLEARPLEGLL